VLASVAGVCLIGIGSVWHGGSPPAETRATMLADLLLIGAVLSWGGYLTVSKPLVMRHGSLPVLTATFLVGALLDLPIAMIASPTIPDLSRITPAAWIALAILTLIITPVNLACQNLAMRRLDASQVANFSNVSPILTVVWGAWLFGESITTTLIAGGALTLAGVFWTGLSRPQCSAVTEGLRSVVERRLGGRPVEVAAAQPAPSASSAAG
jgi:drug/metabolite transporter (DMT)-like permease